MTQAERLDLNLAEPKSVSLSYLFWTFLKVGSTAYGGFMALISVVENLIVERRKLLTHEDMLDGVSLATVLPGPVAVNVVAYVGYRLRGGLGALVSAIGVLLPTFVLVVGLTIFYLQAGEVPAVKQAFAGFIPAIAAIILNAACRMSKKSIKGWREVVIALSAAVLLQFVGGFYTTLAIVIGAGFIGWFWLRDKKASRKIQKQSVWRQLQRLFSPALAVQLVLLLSFVCLYLVPLPFLGETSLAKLFITFSGMSLMLFGGGYVFIPLIQEIVVNGYGWVTQMQFTDAIAIGQITPGPILISAAFIGYVVKGFLGATVATVGIFFPPAMLMLTCSHLLEQIKTSVVIQAALKGIRPAVIGMIFIAAVTVAQTAQIHWASLLIFAGSLVAIWRLRLEVVLVIPIAGILGILLYA